MTVTIYAAGGAATNIARQIGDLDATIVYVDTSNSNLGSIKSDNVYLVDAMDGAGKDRSVAYHSFKDIAADVLLKYKPSEQLNIVIGSLSGGSGSVIGPILSKELISKGYNTVVIGVDSRHSLVELSNAVKTLKTYNAISSQIQKPVPLYYVNQPTRAEADRHVLSLVNLLSLLIDKKRTAEFDNSDLKSFLYFDKTTANDPSVSILEVVPNEILVGEKNTSVVGSILVTTRKESTIHPVIPEYLATCVVVDPQYKTEDARINAVLGKLSLIIDSLERDITVLEDNKKLNKVREVEVSGANADGIVL